MHVQPTDPAAMPSSGGDQRNDEDDDDASSDGKRQINAKGDVKEVHLHEFLAPRIARWETAHRDKSVVKELPSYRPGRNVSVETLEKLAAMLGLNLGSLVIFKNASLLPDGSEAQKRLLASAHELAKNGDAEPRSDPPSSLTEWAWGTRRIGAVVVGDRADVPANSIYDLLAPSSSYLEMRFLSRLDCLRGATIFSHKDVEVHEDLRRIWLNQDVLLVGSSETNLSTRRLHGRALFHSSLSDRARELSAAIYEAGLKLERDRRPHNAGSLTKLEREIRIKFAIPNGKDLLSEYLRPRPWTFVDPVAEHGTSTGTALVTFGPNPWSGEHLAIIVAGARRWRTALALRFLSQPELFQDRPLGGVFDIDRQPVRGWDLESPTLGRDFWWVTPPYSVTDYVAKAQMLNLDEQAAFAARFHK